VLVNSWSKRCLQLVLVLLLLSDKIAVVCVESLVTSERIG
jgi:hypothetical protein